MGQRRWGSRASLAVAALWVAASAHAQATGRIAVTVEDPNGARLAGATVVLCGPSERRAVSGRDGGVAFEGLAEGGYRVEASLAGFAPAEQTVQVADGQSATVAVRMSIRAFEKVVVTAGKTGEQDVQASPLAMSVLSADELAQGGVQSVEGTAGRAPAVTFSQNTGFAQLTIRGIGTNVVFAGSDPSSAVYVDGVYLARPAMLPADFLDVERVEVLRGPQGTLYGRNAVGGALNVVTRPPTDAFQAQARFAIGSLDTLRAEARASGPLVKGRLTGSAALLRGVRDGFVRDLDHPDHPLGGEDVTAARGKLRLALGARSDLVVAGDVTHQDPAPLTYAKVLAVKPGFVVDDPADLHEVRASTLQVGRNLQYGTSARLTLGLSPTTTLTSLTAIRWLDYDVLVDTDITELELAESDVHEIQRQHSQELTVSGVRERLSWVGGLFLLKDDDAQPTSIRLGGPRVVDRLDPQVVASSGAAYAQATLGLSDRLLATAGLRYTHERKTIDNAGRLSPFDQPEATLPGAYAYHDAIAAEAWTPRFALEWRAGGQSLAYASATRGFKSGGFNISSPEPGRGYAPEWAWSYEAGFKRTFASGRARLNLAAFHTDYEDLQVQAAIRPGILDISNAATATIDGIELEGDWRPARAFSLGGHAAWLDARYDEYVAVGVGGVTGDVAGNRLSNAPQLSGRLWLQWHSPARRAGSLWLRSEARLQSGVFYTPFNDAVQRQTGYGLLDVSAGLGPGRWAVSVYARNLLAADYITGSFSSPPPAIGGRPGEPRVLGLDFTLRR